MLVVLLLSARPWAVPPGIGGPLMVAQNASSEVSQTSAYEWTAATFHTPAYKKALMAQLDKDRNTSYAHLNDRRYEKLKKVISNASGELALDGSEPTTFEGYQFDIELKPGAIPARAQLPRMSPVEREKEQHHVRKYEKSNQPVSYTHLTLPTKRIV